MTKADLIEDVSQVVEMSRKDSEVIVETIFDSIIKSLHSGDKIEIRGFGSFRTRPRKARIGRNPKTGAPVDVPAKRIPYVSEGTEGKGCIFCELAAAPPSADRERYILHRGPSCFAVLNLYPYTTGHTLVAPYAHGGDLLQLPSQTLNEMMALGNRVLAALEAGYRPQGYNLGINLGQVAGAGVADHLHLHVLPRWRGDANFMTAVGETRVLPEDLGTTYDKLAGLLQK
jgi:ATP adenylyltransferase